MITKPLTQVFSHTVAQKTKEKSEYSGGVLHVLLSRKEKIEMLLYEVGLFYKSNDLPFGV